MACGAGSRTGGSLLVGRRHWLADGGSGESGATLGGVASGGMALGGVALGGVAPGGDAGGEGGGELVDASTGLLLTVEKKGRMNPQKPPAAWSGALDPSTS